jgi:hypothetical protein
MLETSDSWLSAKIVRVDNHEATTCLKKVEAYVALLLFIAITVLIKRYVFRPVLELHLKKKFAERLRSRRRRLKDLLNDQTLLAGLERKLEQRYNGDKRRVMADLENLHLLAETDVTDEDDKSKGDERQQAAQVLWAGTFFLSVLTLLFFSISNVVFSLGMDSYSSVKLQLQQDLCGNLQSVDVFLPVATYLFLFLHFVDGSIMVVMMPSSTKKKRSLSCDCQEQEESKNSTVLQPP